MIKIPIEKGESVSLAFQINTTETLIDFSVYIGSLQYSISKGNLIQNDNLYTLKIPSNVTFRLIGSVPISYAVTTDLLGVYKENKIGTLEVGCTNEITNNSETADFNKATFIITIDTEQVTTNSILENIYSSGGIINHSELILDDGTNPHGTTKADVGLGNVDNTTDIDKPISTATQNALNLKQNIDNLTTNNAVIGTYNIDYNILTHNLTLVGNATFSESNLPVGTETRIIELYVKGNFALTYPANWTTFIIGSYIGKATINQIVVKYISAGVYFIVINQPD